MLCLQGIAKGVHMRYQFYKEPAGRQGQQAAHAGDDAARGLRVIDVPHMNQFQETPHEILAKLVTHFHVPELQR